MTFDMIQLAWWTLYQAVSLSNMLDGKFDSTNHHPIMRALPDALPFNDTDTIHQPVSNQITNNSSVAIYPYDGKDGYIFSEPVTSTLPRLPFAFHKRQSCMLLEKVPLKLQKRHQRPILMII